MTALGQTDSNDTPAMSAVCAAYRATQTADAAFAPLSARATPPADGKTRNSLAAQLDTVAAAVKAGVPARVYMVSLGGFDTHADERATQQRLLGTLDAALTGFLHDMAGDKHGKNVVLLAYSEFGRRVLANASQGTDLDDGDLKPTTDFRDIYHELLATTLGADPTVSVGTGRRNLGFL
jgi:uncharacterized protein (DUF1501 family)